MEETGENQPYSKGSKVFLIVSIAVIIVASLYFCNAKQGYFLDELYSYGLSNSYYSPFIKTLEDGDIVGKTIDKAEIYNYLNVSEDGSDAFKYKSVYYNQVNDVHPPLFYAFLHTACSICPGDLSKWTGLVVNLIFFGFTLLLVYLITKHLSRNGNIATLAMLVYGLSSSGLSNMLYIRMYMLLALLTVLLAYLIILLIEKPRPWIYPAIALTIFLGLLTQYFYVFYAFFVCLFLLCWFIYKRWWKKAGLLTLFGLGGVAAFVIFWRACFSHLFSDKSSSGSSVMTNLTHPDLMLRHIETFFQQCVEQLPLALILGAIGLIVFIIWRARKQPTNKLTQGPAMAVIVLGAACVAVIFQVILPPYLSLRYQYNVIPLLIILCCLLFGKIPVLVKASQYIWPAFVVAAIAFIAISQPLYLYQDDPSATESIKEHSSCPCIYVSANSSACVTSDMIQLLELDDFHVEDDINEPGTVEYLSGKDLSDGLIVYVGAYPAEHDTNAIMEKLMSEYNLGEPQALYSKGYSTAYYLPSLS